MSLNMYLVSNEGDQLVDTTRNADRTSFPPLEAIKNTSHTILRTPNSSRGRVTSIRRSDDIFSAPVTKLSCITTPNLTNSSVSWSCIAIIGMLEEGRSLDKGGNPRNGA